MENSQNQYDKVVDLASSKGIFRLRDAKEIGVHPEYVRRLFERGVLDRVARGTYRLVDANISEYQTLVEACSRVPGAVGCLLSALSFHDLTTQLPHEVWLAIDRHAKKPKIDDLPIRFVHFSGPALREGVEQHTTVAGKLRVYSIEKTIADCFRFRNKIGTDVAVEALKDAQSRGALNLSELWRFSEIRGVTKTIQPYIEALT